jgi:hypothetical protein
MTSNEEHDEGKLQEVVEDEVASNTSGGVDILTLLREEMPYVSNLEEEDS